jgi:hypothetical protein
MQAGTLRYFLHSLTLDIGELLTPGLSGSAIAVQ